MENNTRVFDNGAHVDKIGEVVHGWIRVRVSNDRTAADGKVYKAITKRTTSKGGVADVFAFGTYGYGSGRNLKYFLGNDVLNEKSMATVRISAFSHTNAAGQEVNVVDMLKLQPGSNIIVTGTFARHEYNGRVSIEVRASDIQYDGRKSDTAGTATAATPQQTTPVAAQPAPAPTPVQAAPTAAPAPAPAPQAQSSFVDPFAEFMNVDGELPFA